MNRLAFVLLFSVAALEAGTLTAQKPEARPNFSGNWVLAVGAAGNVTALDGVANYCGGGVTGSLGPFGNSLSWGRRIAQDDKTLSISGVTASGEDSRVYNLDGSASTNVLGTVVGKPVYTSSVRWEGRKLVITTSGVFNGQPVDRMMSLAIDGDSLVVDNSGRGGRGGADPAPFVQTYRRCEAAGAIIAEARRVLAEAETLALADVAVVRVPAALSSEPSRAAPSAAWLGDHVGIGSATTLAVKAPAGAGSLVIVMTAGRGRASTIGAVRDSRGNVWQAAVQAMNSSELCSVGVFYATLTQALTVGDSITATWMTPTYAHAVGALKASNVRTLDQIGSAAQDSETNLSATTAVAVTAPAELLVSATCTGQNQATTFTSASGFVRQLQFSGAYSSGTLSYRTGSGLSGVQSYLSTAQAAPGGAGNFATVIATFK
jgi:hypothetical protein